MVGKIREQRIIAIVARAQGLTRELGDRAPDRLDLGENVEFVFELNINSAEIFGV